MYYRVAIQRQADQRDRPSGWQWTSTPLSSLETLIQFLRRYGAQRLDHLRVFSSSSREGLQEQLVQENQGHLSCSVTAAHFLQERLIHCPEGKWGTPARDEGAGRRWQPSLLGAIAARSHPAVKDISSEGNGLVGRGVSSLETRRLEIELGPGGDHDVPYRFVLPALMPQVLAWMSLFARIRRGEWQA